MIDNPSLATEAIHAALTKQVATRSDLLRLVREVAGQHGAQVPPIRELLAAYNMLVAREPALADTRLASFLLKARGRSLSGVAVVTVLTKPYPCPGRCIYCPSAPNMPKSYLADEPAAARAAACDFDPYRQIEARLRALTANGHEADKVELIVKGGTWSAYPWEYQQQFIKNCFDACNDFAAAQKNPSVDLATAQHGNESAKHRVIGLTLETRPDRITPSEIARLRVLGCTRVELGVQSLDDRKLELCRRGHDVAAVVRATRLLKNAGYKTDYHLMPQLPDSTPQGDLEELRRLFTDFDFRPDMLKIYPCTVLAGTELFDWWRAGRYAPYDDAALKEIIIAAKTSVPRYCRLSRIIRDIPSPDIQAGNRDTALRQTIQREMTARELRCVCLRCREVGRHPELLHEPTQFFDDAYEASEGTEHFLSIEDTARRAVFAFCRLRLPRTKSSAAAEEAQQLFTALPEIARAAFIRELHTYGHLVPIDTDDPTAAQHHGYGKRLMAEAERLARDAGFKRLAVISGVGVRGYYQKLGYQLMGTYMVKEF